MACPGGGCPESKGGTAKKIAVNRGKTQSAKQIQKPSGLKMPKSTLTRRGANYR
jgi:hypothetical protein